MSLTLNEYLESTHKTAMYVGFTKEQYEGCAENLGLLYSGLGLAGEAGEVADEIKKLILNDGGKILPERKEKMLYELGDTLWYLARVANHLGYTLEEIAQANIDKLTKRLEEDTIKER